MLYSHWRRAVVSHACLEYFFVVERENFMWKYCKKIIKVHQSIVFHLCTHNTNVYKYVVELQSLWVFFWCFSCQKCPKKNVLQKKVCNPRNRNFLKNHTRYIIFSTRFGLYSSRGFFSYVVQRVDLVFRRFIFFVNVKMLRLKMSVPRWVQTLFGSLLFSWMPQVR